MQKPLAREDFAERVQELYRERILFLGSRGIERLIVSPFDSHHFVTYPLQEKAKEVREEELFEGFRDGAINLYVGMPFCNYICTFCPYVTFLSKDGSEGQYLEMVRKEIRLQAARLKGSKVVSIYVGGGTPTTLSPQMLGSLLLEVRGSFDIEEGAEITVEGSPETLSSKEGIEKLKLLKSYGVNRLSFGVQTFNEDILRGENRRHTAQQAREAAEKAKEAGIGNINIDLIPGLRGHTFEIWQSDVEHALELGVPSLTAYPYTVHPQRTPKAFENYQKDPATYPDVFEFAAMYNWLQQFLKTEDFRENPPWWFTKGGFEYKQQMKKWGENGMLVGLGVDAYSWLNNWQYWNHSTLREYGAALEAGRLPVAGGAHLPLQRDRAIRHLLFGIRTGIERAEFQRKYGLLPKEIFTKEFEVLSKVGLVDLSHDQIELTDLGKMFSDEVIFYLYRNLETP